MRDQLFEIAGVGQIVLLVIVPEPVGHLTQEPVEVADPAKTFGLDHHPETWVIEKLRADLLAHGSGESIDMMTWNVAWVCRWIESSVSARNRSPR
jgi:hypothetical protein